MKRQNIRKYFEITRKNSRLGEKILKLWEKISRFQEKISLVREKIYFYLLDHQKNAFKRSRDPFTGWGTDVGNVDTEDYLADVMGEKHRYDPLKSMLEY